MVLQWRVTLIDLYVPPPFHVLSRPPFQIRTYSEVSYDSEDWEEDFEEEFEEDFEDEEED